MLRRPYRTYHAVCLYVLGLDHQGWNISNIQKFIPRQEILSRGNSASSFMRLCVCPLTCALVDVRTSWRPLPLCCSLSLSSPLLSLTVSPPLAFSHCSLSLSNLLLTLRFPLSFSSSQGSQLLYAWPDSSRYSINRCSLAPIPCAHCLPSFALYSHNYPLLVPPSLLPFPMFSRMLSFSFHNSIFSSIFFHLTCIPSPPLLSSPATSLLFSPSISSPSPLLPLHSSPRHSSPHFSPPLLRTCRSPWLSTVHCGRALMLLNCSASKPFTLMSTPSRYPLPSLSSASVMSSFSILHFLSLYLCAIPPFQF